MAAAFTLDHVTIHYSEKELLRNASLTVSEGEKIGVVGRNGAGKSTLLKLLAGVEQPDSGVVSRKNGLTVAYLPQAPQIDPNASILDQALSYLYLKDAGKREEAAYEVKSILSRLGFTDFSAAAGALSGGQQKRVALAGILARPLDALLLDEPTNHIDTEMVDWLEDKLSRYRGTLVMVTHDRYFLSRVCRRIVEVEGGQAVSYQAAFEGYLSLKAQRMEMADASLRKNQAIYKKELAWIQRGARARSTKAKGRVQAFEQLKEEISPNETQGVMEIKSAAARLGKKILSWEGLTKAFQGHTVIKDFSYTLLRDDRIGIVGPNGAGKTTLLNLLSGGLAPDGGAVERGETVRIGYFRQHCPAMEENVRVIDAARDVAVKVVSPEGDLSASQMLEKFLFPLEMQYQQVARLSGGEKRRLYLMRVLMAAPNVLFLDEPTNDLDIDTLAVLEDYLDSFPGAVIAVSHDRYFLDRVTKRLFAISQGSVRQYEGGYAAYAAGRKATEEEKRPSPPPAAPRNRERSNALPKKKRFTFQEQRDFETIEDTIASLEREAAQVERDLAAYGADFQRAGELMERQRQLEERLAKAMDRWVYLTELYEEIQREQEAKP